MTALREQVTPAGVAPQTDESTVLDVRDLRMRYGTTDVLDGVDVHRRAGARCWPCSGRTAPARPPRSRSWRASGCARPARSRVLGVDPAHGDEPWRARLGVVLQSWRDHGKWRVRELLAHLGRYYAAYSTDAIRRPWDVDELIEVVGLTEHADKQDRPALRRAAAPARRGDRHRRPAGAAVPGRADGRLRPGRPGASSTTWCTGSSDVDDTTILLTTHDLDEAEKLADRILILAGGRIIADGSRRRAVPADRRPRPRCAGRRDGERFVHSTDGRHPVRPRAVRPVRRGDRRPGGAPGQPGGHLHGPGARARVRRSGQSAVRRSRR